MGCFLMLVVLQTGADVDNIAWVSSQFTGLLQFIFLLAAILILAYVALRFGLPKILGLGSVQSGPIGVVARYALEPRRNLYIVHVGTEYFLIGTSETNIRYLTQLDANKLEPTLDGTNDNTPSGEFKRLLGVLTRPPKH